ncbi:MAG TPA: nuclear transport factor 2 family protein [Terriglobales bacterium]|nr:nuclear transport factor 2 family protein [Terriglobales bacterium]
MKKTLRLFLICLFALGVAAQNSPSDAKTADEIKKLETDFSQASIKDGAAAVEKYEADDIIDTDPAGNVTTKAQDKQAAASGDLKFESIEPSAMVVHVYGNTAVVVGLVQVKGTFKQQDISGKYRFTDTWVKRNGKWQEVASESVKVAS